MGQTDDRQQVSEVRAGVCEEAAKETFSSITFTKYSSGPIFPGIIMTIYIYVLFFMCINRDRWTSWSRRVSPTSTGDVIHAKAKLLRYYN